jgi:UDP-N-acetyl-D-glucosamine dehydrogenase
MSSGLLQAADCVVIVSDHSYYDVPWIVREARCIVDTRNMTRGHDDICLENSDHHNGCKYDML